MDKILVIDDERATLSMLRLLLRAYGYSVFTAEDASKGLDLFRKEQPPIVLTDIKMPGMDGIQLLKILKGESPDTEIIMITGHGDIELAIQSLKYRATDFITKPINNEMLEIALKRANEMITFRKKINEYTENLEHLVEEKTKKLLDSERMVAVGQTVAGLAHAIKNVAGGLKGGGFVLEKGIELKNERYLTQGWGMVKANVDRLLEMALDLLNYAKERKPEYELCDPNRPVLEVLDLLKSRARENGVFLKADLARHLEKAWFDPKGIYKALLDLVTNAVEACTDLSSPNKSGEVVVRSLKPEGWAVEYQVMDNGCGMTEEVKNKILRDFFSTKGSKGTGLGLMITKKTIDEHAGIILVESEKDKGTTVLIRLPERYEQTLRNKI